MNKQPALESLSEQDKILAKRVLNAYQNKDELIKGDFTPPHVIPLAKTKEDLKFQQRAKEKGEQSLREGKIACFLVAGGQGTRLGFSGPKGCFQITSVKKKSFYQLFCEKIQALQKIYACHIPLYIMTSEATHADTQNFFQSHHNFRLTITLLQQGILPTLSKNGELLFQNGKLLKHPNGHGGALSLMKKIIPELKKKNIEHIFYFQVDNLLANICDPLFLGYHALAQADMSAKVVEKTDPEEKVGLVVQQDGKTKVIEYTDLSTTNKQKRSKGGKLTFNAANIAIHAFSTSFLEHVQDELPLHKAFKKIQINKKEREVIKYETFIFDALPLAKKTMTLMVRREEEFAPVKNKEGQDSPKTAQHLQNNVFQSWLKAEGITVDCVMEISPLYALNKEEFIKKKPLLKLQQGKKYYLDDEGHIN